MRIVYNYTSEGFKVGDLLLVYLRFHDMRAEYLVLANKKLLDLSTYEVLDFHYNTQARSYEIVENGFIDIMSIIDGNELYIMRGEEY